ncbi:hypothetical protein DW790_05840 [Firmicutes bacterium AM31-12AC]|nr:hypothetical protein DW790_05840 [Firmicutes bacterium AM31-12AC]
MEKYDVVLNTKGLRKAAFAVGFGLCMGKAVANTIDTFVWAGLAKILNCTANELESDRAKRKGWKYESDDSPGVSEEEK